MNDTGQEIQLGRISGVHGVKGWVKVFSFTDPMENILGYPNWSLKRRRDSSQVEVLEGRRQGKGVIARLSDVDDRNQAEELVGYEIWVAKQRLPDLEDGEFYWHQLEGLSVLNESGVRLGIVDHLMETGANDVLVVSPDPESIDDRQRLIPFVEESVVRQVNLAAAEVVVAWEAEY